MLTKIELHDFQCHGDLSIELGKITTLVGASDSGKSAVIRALDWAVYNNGRTAQLIRRGAKAATVTIHVDDHIVTRTTKKNAYIVDGTELSSIGRSQPVDVPNIFRMGEDNIQRQHEYLFWFSASGSELTRNFNRVVDLSKLDEWVHAGVEIEKKYRQDVQYCSQRLDELANDEQALLPYESLDEELRVLRTSYETLELGYKQLEEIRRLCDDHRTAGFARRSWEHYFADLSGLLTRHDEIMREGFLVSLCDELQCCVMAAARHRDLVGSLGSVLAEYQALAGAQKSFLSLLGCCRAYRDGESQLAALRVAASVEIPFDELFSLRKELSELAKVIVFLRVDIPDSSPASSSLEEFREVSYQLYEISTTISALFFNKEAIQKLKATLASEKAAFEKASGGVCPLCGQTGGHIHG